MGRLSSTWSPIIQPGELDQSDGRVTMKRVNRPSRFLIKFMALTASYYRESQVAIYRSFVSAFLYGGLLAMVIPATLELMKERKQKA